MSIVRDVTRLWGCSIIYCEENGYFSENEFDGPDWQFGSNYFEMQKLYARLERGELPTREEMIKVVNDYCGLMHRASYLRSFYNSALDVLHGRAEFRSK